MTESRLFEIFSGKIAVFTAHAAVQRNADAVYAFEQESNFFWLTGITEPDWKLIVDGYEGRTWLVAPATSQQREIFDGSTDHDEIRRISGIQTIISEERATQLLSELAEAHTSVYALADHPHAEYFEFVINPAPAKLWSLLQSTFKTVEDCRGLLAKHRAIKSDEEISKIQAAIDVTVESFSKVHDTLNSFAHEYEIEAEFNYSFTRHGTEGHAYDPIVAGGAHACTLHYGKNSAALPGNGLVLLDIGARFDGYAADITRTYAIGTPSDREKAVHAAVEEAHHKIIQLLGPEVNVRQYHEQVDVIMKQALQSLDLFHSEDDFRKYFPHAISHGLGVDVHDALGKPDVFKAGMVLTVEPGIYIPEEGIGVRIEDDILITETGNRNLSQALPTSL